MRESSPGKSTKNSFCLPSACGSCRHVSIGIHFFKFIFAAKPHQGTVSRDLTNWARGAGRAANEDARSSRTQCSHHCLFHKSYNKYKFPNRCLWGFICFKNCQIWSRCILWRLIENVLKSLIYFHRFSTLSDSVSWFAQGAECVVRHMTLLPSILPKHNFGYL